LRTRRGIGLRGHPHRREYAASTGPAAAAVTLRAALPDLTALTAAERALLGDWLDRIAESQRVPGENRAFQGCGVRSGGPSCQRLASTWLMT